MKNKIIFILLPVLFSSCIRKKLNGHDADKIESLRTRPVLSECAVKLSPEMKTAPNLKEIAKLAARMKVECEMSEDEVFTAAESVF